MRLANFTDYSLRVLIYLALKGEELATVSEISARYDISNNHLVKVVHNLAKLGIVNSFKGKGGGICLAHPAQSLNIGKIMKMLDQESSLVECFSDDDNCKIAPACKLKSALAQAEKSFYKSLEEFTLADIVSNESYLRKKLEI